MSATLTDAMALSEPLRSYKFTAIITPPASIANFFDTTELQLRIVSTSLPTLQIAPLDVSYGGLPEVRYAGRATFDKQWQTMIVEGLTGRTYLGLSEWSRLCFDPETGVQIPSPDNWGSALVGPNSVDNTPVFQNKLVGLWPIIRPGMQFASADSNIAPLSCIWAYTAFYPVAV